MNDIKNAKDSTAPAELHNKENMITDFKNIKKLP